MLQRYFFLSVAGLLCFALFACAPNAPKIKRTGLKPVNEAYHYPQKKGEGNGSLSTYSEGKPDAY